MLPGITLKPNSVELNLAIKVRSLPPRPPRDRRLPLPHANPVSYQECPKARRHREPRHRRRNRPPCDLTGDGMTMRLNPPSDSMKNAAKPALSRLFSFIGPGLVVAAAGIGAGDVITATVTGAPAPAPTPAPSSGGGGGAVSPLFIGALGLLLLARRTRRLE